jgi:RND family efflux transporter MFP subunit
LNAYTHLEEDTAYAVPAPEPAQRSRRRRWLIGAAAIVLIAGVGWKLFHHADAPPPPPPATVQVAHPLVREVTQWDDYVGRFAPSQTVEVRPRVSGAVTAIHFHDGDYVQKGQLLFTIDQRPYQAAYAEARADVASARSALALANSDLARLSGLKGDEAVAASEVDSVRARVRAASAALGAAQARADRRALDVEFSVVRAPIAGRISDRRVDVGNLVSGDNGSSATLLTTINAVDPIYFTFDASEALYLKAQRDRAANRPPATVEVRLQDETEYRWRGKLTFSDNGLDQRSGTIRIRATLDNKGGFLTPGMFGNMRLTSGGTVQAMLVPDAAVQADQARKTVSVVGSDGLVAVKEVQVGPVVDGLRVIRSGLSASDTVIISNFQAAAAGSKVTVTRGTIAATPEAKAAPASVEPMAAQATLQN